MEEFQKLKVVRLREKPRESYWLNISKLKVIVHLRRQFGPK